MADEINDRTIALAISAEKVTARVLRDAMRAYLHRNRKKSHSKTKAVSRGKHSLKEMKKGNTELTSITISDKNIKSFDRCARKYHVAYALKKDKASDPPKYYVFFAAKSADQMTAAFKEFTATALKKQERPSIKAKLKEKKILAETLHKESKVKNKKREVER